MDPRENTSWKHTPEWPFNNRGSERKRKKTPTADLTSEQFQLTWHGGGATIEQLAPHWLAPSEVVFSIDGTAISLS